jgi:hypothetical protein
MTSSPIVVAGDVSIDWLAWPWPAQREGEPPNWRQVEGTRMVARRGGALLLVDLLRHATPRLVIGQQVDNIAIRSPDEYLHSMVDLAPAGAGHRVTRLRGFSGPVLGSPKPPPLEQAAEAAAVLVLDDSGNGFRDDDFGWDPLLVATQPQTVIVKMARPLAIGEMWNTVRASPFLPGGKRRTGFLLDPQRLVVVVNADDLRAEGIALSRRLSWEQTAEDFVRQLASNGRLASLVTAAHLIVRFDCDGVIHHRGRSDARPVLYFDPERVEGDLIDACGGTMMGMTAAFTAGLAAALAEDPAAIDRGIIRGMTAAQRLAEAGFRQGIDGAPDYPHAHAMANLPDRRIVAIAIPTESIVAGQRWEILEATLGDAATVARRLVQKGPAVALARVPTARFGKLLTADRREAESFRAIANLLREYLASRPTKPISIGVFGPPGAGKSFGVVQVATAVAEALDPQGRKDDRRKPLEFNLSQFTSPADLAAAFQLVRDEALGGRVPLVFFDEFDSDLGTPFGWLRHFLAPMQDGKFREGGHLHPLGPAIFVFAGGTRRSYAHFAAPMQAPEDSEVRRDFVAAKGPDFASRLRGFVDILGPDQVDEQDRTYMVRRAFLLRNLLRDRESRLLQGEGCNIDDGALHALLSVPAYRHGARSMEAVLAASRLSGQHRFERAALPPAAQLGLHVDAADFIARVQGERLPEALREQLGKALHEAYRRKRRAGSESKAVLATKASMRDWRRLSEDLRESNRQQADDIPRKLREIGCFMAPEDGPHQQVEALTPKEALDLAKAEHERWNAERLQAHWRLGERAPESRTSPFLRPWDDLDEEARTLDINAIHAIPEVLRAAGWCVYRTG